MLIACVNTDVLCGRIREYIGFHLVEDYQYKVLLNTLKLNNTGLLQ